MRSAILILWPSFIAAGIAEILFFTLVNPSDLYIFGEAVPLSAMATYSLGFFAFWLITGVSSWLTCYLQCPLDQAGRNRGPDGLHGSAG